MENQLSEFGKLNIREKLKGLALAIVASVVTLVWGALSPVVEQFVNTSILDFSSFGEAVNLTTIAKVAFLTATSYLGLTKFSGEKK